MQPVDENTRWVIVEMKEQPGTLVAAMAPVTLKVPSDFKGQIIWYVFTEGWQIDPDRGVHLTSAISDWGSQPHEDPTRPGCWRLQANGQVPKSTQYSIYLRDPNDKLHSIDPVIENEAPPTIEVLSEAELVDAVA